MFLGFRVRVIGSSETQSQLKTVFGCLSSYVARERRGNRGALREEDFSTISAFCIKEHVKQGFCCISQIFENGV